MPTDNVIAVGLLTARNVDDLGPTFTRLWPVEDTPCFSQLLVAIDDADRALKREVGTEK
jgi:hypothetical protein